MKIIDSVKYLIKFDEESRYFFRYFKPTYTYSFWGLRRTTSWTMRENPLTEKQVYELFDENKF